MESSLGARMTLANELKNFSSVPSDDLPESSGIFVVSCEVGGNHTILYAAFADNINSAAKEAVSKSSFLKSCSGNVCYLLLQASRSHATEEHARKLRAYVQN